MFLEHVIGSTTNDLIISTIGVHALNHKNLVIILWVDVAADQPGFVVILFICFLHTNGFLVCFADDCIVVAFGEGMLFCLHINNIE
jgi:hypothetical protein